MTKTKSEIISDLYPDAPSIKTAELEAADVVGLWTVNQAARLNAFSSELAKLARAVRAFRANCDCAAGLADVEEHLAAAETALQKRIDHNNNPPPTTCIICGEDKPIYAVGRCQACHVAANERP